MPFGDRLTQDLGFQRRRATGGSNFFVVLAAEMGDDVFTHHPTQRVLQLGELNEQVVLGVEARCNLRALVVEAQPFLNATHASALCKVAEQDEVECKRGSEDRVATQEVDLDLHGVTQPASDVDVVPALFGIATRWVVVDGDFVEDVAVQLGVIRRLKNVFEHTKL